MTNRRALGRGLNSLIPENINQNLNNYTSINRNNSDDELAKDEDILNKEKQIVTKLPIDKVKPRDDQPRKTFDEDSLQDLANSIEEYGLLNPIVVTKKDDHYEILAGERRYRASKKIGAKDIDVIIKDYDNKDIEVLSLVENIQREDLKPLEEALAYKRLSENYKMTQEEISKTVGKSRSYVANTLRLLNLNDDEKNALNYGKISPSQARTLLSIEGNNQRSKALGDFINGKTNIRKVEKKASESKNKSSNKAKNKELVGPSIDDILFEDLEEKFMEKLGSKVKVQKNGKTYKVIIDCYTIEDIESVYDKLTKAN